jgi:Flp pilus assembly protein TadG
MIRRTKRERGVAMVLAAIWLTAMIAISALTIEVSRLTDTSTEVQVAADAAALAAAQNMIRGGTTDSATIAARTVAGSNKTDGRAPAPADVALQFGSYTPSVGFTPGGANNAVHATVTIQNVRYLLATVFGFGSSTTVQKTATATYECVSNRQPTAPIGICDCMLKTYTQGQPCSTSGTTLTQSPDPTQNSCWLADPSGAPRWFPPECGGGSAPFVSVGDSINLTNGQMTPILRDFQNCVDAGGRDQGVHDYVVPVIRCSGSPCSIGQCNHSAEVVGFATMHIAHSSDIDAHGNPKGITFTQICNNDAAGTGGNSGPGGATCFGSGNAKLVDSGSGST